MNIHNHAARGPARGFKRAACIGLIVSLIGLTGCFDLLGSGYSDWGYSDYGYSDYGYYDSGYGYGSGAGASGYGWSEYDSYGNSGASFSLGGDPGESVQNYLSSFVQY